MKNVVISTSKGKNTQIKTSAQTWGELSAELTGNGYDLSGMKAIIGGLNVTLESTEAVLPTSDFTLFLSPVKIKAGADASDYEFEWELDDVEDLDYNQLRAELKSIRVQATELEDEETLELIGNYTHLSVSALKDTLTEVYNTFVEEEEEEDEIEEEKEGVFSPQADSQLETRVFEIEYRLGIVNDDNEERFFSRKDSERESVLRTI